MSVKAKQEPKSLTVSPARSAVFDVLMAVAKGSGHTSSLLPEAEEQLSPQDRGLCHEITLGVLRRQMYLDRLIDVFTASKKLDLEISIALRIGLFQLLFLDRVPNYSVINESVNLVKRARKRSAAGFVNAILRNAVRGIPNLKFLSDIDRISVESSHPKWLIERWIREFGVDRAEGVTTANNVTPEVTYRETERGSAAGVLIDELAPGELNQLFDDGWIYFQDKGSQLVALSLDIQKEDAILDMCAAPGSKTTMLRAELTRAGGGRIVATDINEKRLAVLRAILDRQGSGPVEVVPIREDEDLPFAAETFDKVLVDAPCSGTGTIRHNPELRYLISEDSISASALKQRGILEKASKVVKAGGIITYSTCSLERDENEEVVSEFLSRHNEFQIAEPGIDASFIEESGFGRTFPDRDGMDGFFIASLRKTAGGPVSQ